MFCYRFLCSVFNNTPDTFKEDFQDIIVSYRHIDHSLYVDIISKITGEIQSSCYFLTYEFLCSLYYDYMLIFDGLSYPKENIYYQFQRL